MMKQPEENISTTNSDFMTCNGHQDELIKTRQDSDNDDAATNTSSTSSINDVSFNNCPNVSSSSSSNLNASGITTTNPNNSNELVLLPEVSFNIRIQSPGLDIFDLSVTSSELVQEIHQVLMDKEETCHRTCFSLQLDGIILDNFSELKNIDGLKEGSLIKVVEEQYTVREVRIHIRHINDLIHACDLNDLYNGTNNYSLCLVNDINNSETSSSSSSSNTDRRKSAETSGSDSIVPEYLLPNQKDILLTPLFTTNNKINRLHCLKILSYSGWNPPNGSRKLHGDLMYLKVTTCEEKSFHITACTKGFYVSQTTDEKFLPKPVQPKAIFHSLVDLLNNISPIFKKKFRAIQRKRCTKHPFERIQIPFQIHPWLSPRFEHTIDHFRAEDANINKLGHEDHIPGQVRDWNEELQITKELPKKNLPERLIRERAMFKVHTDFVSAAIRGCQAVVDGNIMAINPGEESKVHMYIWNNMFFSLGFDVKDHYKDFGGDAAAHSAPTNDLQGVRAINTLDLDGLHTLGTVVVDYRGMRVTAQSIVPARNNRERIITRLEETYKIMLIHHHRQRWLFIILIFGFFLLIYKYNQIRKYYFTDEHRIYTSLLIELPNIERLIRLKQANLTIIQNRLKKIEKYLTKYTWHLNRLIKTIDYNKKEEKKIFHFNSFDFDLEKNIHKNYTKFLVCFHLIKSSNDDIDYQILNEFHLKISKINSPYITLNKSEAYLNIIYLPIQSYQRNICYKDLINENYFVLYEFLNPINEDIDEKCFHGNFLHVKFFTQFNTNQTYVNNDRWRLNDEEKSPIGIIYLNTTAIIAAHEYDRLKNAYEITIECSHRSCYQTILNKNISIISLICSSIYSISIQYEFYDAFFYFLSQQIHINLFNCENYLPYSNIIDWLHPSISLSWLYTIYFQTFQHRFHTLIAYLRTYYRLPTLSNELKFHEIKNQLVKEKNFYYLIHSRNINFTRMSIGLMDKINFQTNKKYSIHIEPTFYDQWNRLYQPFYRSKTQTNPFEISFSHNKYTIIILTHKKRFYQLNRLLLHLNGLINLDRILVLFNQVDSIENFHNKNFSLNNFLDNYSIYLPSIHVDIIYIFNLTNNLNNRFLPWNEFIHTDCILSLDDDSFLRHDEIEYAFHIWKEYPSRLIGFISRSHKSNTLEYDASSLLCSYSMILTGAAFLHRWYLDFYTNIMSEQIRQYIKLHMNCEDIAMNFLISYLTKQTPIKIGHRETFYCYKCQDSLSSILEKEQEQSVVYGSTDFGKTCTTNEKYKELLEKVSTMLKIKPHTIKTEKGDSIELLTAVECKGIIGNDGRHYLLDLLRMTPPDLNYLPVDVEHLSPSMKQFDYPKTYKHRLCCLRQELIDAFVEQKYVDFYRSIALNLSRLRSNESISNETTERTNVEEAKRIVNEISVEDNSREIIQSACRSIGSVKDNEFDVRFNPDLFQPHVTLNQTSDETVADIKLLKEAAEYLVLKQIPLMIQDFQDHSSVPVDGESLSEAMHSRGINIRYLGRIAQLLTQQSSLTYIYEIVVTEILCRSTKHVFRTYLQSVPIHLLSYSISHFLNCFLTIISLPTTDYTFDELASATTIQSTNTTSNVLLTNSTNISSQKSNAKKKNKKQQQQQRKHSPMMRNESLEFSSITSKVLWSQIINEAKSRYSFDLNCDDIESFVENYAVRRTCILRSFCRKTGLQITMREYQFETINKSIRSNNECFNENDIINIFPIIKHVPPKPSDAYQFFTSGQQKIQQGLLREGFELISEAHNLLNNVYGPMHPEISMCLRLLARLNYIMGDYQEALMTQHKAVMMSERVLGIDHPQTATEYIHMALYSFANGLSINASKLLCRARYIILTCCGENHPQISLIDSNLGLILQSYGDYENALKFMEKSLELNKTFYGTKSLKVALSHHLCARIQSCRGDFRSALNSEREAYQIYKLQLGDEHERTRESAQVLKHLTEQAVVLQKRINDVVKGQLLVIPSLTIQQPSFQNVLEMLNVVNGILFIQIREKDLDLLREEFAKQSIDDQQASTSSVTTISEVANQAAALLNNEID
ncbi:unnamed protein product [Rotaria sp. Silwood1]|nr:unnamed protein product [Rotaria sp. Silwood1]